MSTYKILLITAQETVSTAGGPEAHDELAEFRRALQGRYNGVDLQAFLSTSGVLHVEDTSDLYDVMEKVRGAIPVPAQSINVVCIVGHGAPGCLYLHRDKWFAPRSQGDVTDGSATLRQPCLNGDEVCRVLFDELSDYLALDADVTLIGCDFGADSDELTPLSPGAQVAAGLAEALDPRNTLRRVCFTNGRVLAADAAAIIAGKSLFTVDVKRQGNDSTRATLSVEPAKPRHESMGILPFAG